MNTRHEKYEVSENVIANLKIDVFDGEEGDVEVHLEGLFAISSSSKKEFFDSLSKLIRDHRI